MQKIELGQPRCVDCQHCIPIWGSLTQESTNPINVIGRCLNPDIPLEMVYVTLPPTLNLSMKGRIDIAEKIYNQTLNCFSPRQSSNLY